MPRSAATLPPGTRLGAYELLTVLAVGGMGAVWLARSVSDRSRVVAIKTISAQHADDPEFKRMLLDEARIASMVENDHVVRVLGFAEEGNVAYVVMEWVSGDSLRRIHSALEKKGIAIPLGVLLRVIADACAGLHAAHELVGEDGRLLNVVHRDVSPENILVADDGTAKLIDFGVAKARGRLAETTASERVKGKLRYMAPEQLGKYVDRRADVWAFGALLYELLEGRPPYDGDTDLEILFRLTTKTPTRPMTLAPAPLAAVIERCLRVDPAERFETTSALSVALDTAAGTMNVRATARDVADFLAASVPELAQHRQRKIDAALRPAGDAASPQGRRKNARGPSAPPGPTLGQRLVLPAVALLFAVITAVVMTIALLRLGGDGDPASSSAGSATETKDAATLPSRD